MVDDESLVLDVNTRCLVRAGFTVISASSGQAALQILESRDGAVDLLLIDLTMPDLSGQETLVLVHQRWPELPAILTSGYDATDRQRNSTDVVGFLQKPYCPDELLAAVRAANV